MGVKVHPGVSFSNLIEPANANSGWTVKTTPSSCAVTSYHFDIIIGADGKQNSLPGFHSKEFRAKLALAITVNFVNSSSKHESSVPEISGVAYLYRQDFFNTLADRYGISLENIVYFKDETHYFVMTAKKHSLLGKGVLKRVRGSHKYMRYVVYAVFDDLAIVYNRRITTTQRCFSPRKTWTRKHLSAMPERPPLMPRKVLWWTCHLRRTIEERTT